MKYIIKNIIKEDYINKQKIREYIDFVVNDMLDSITLTDYHPFDDGRFSTISEFVSMYGEEELDRISSNPEFYNEYGWDEVEYEDGYYYFRMDNPEDEYDFDEFNLEFGYDWLNHLVDIGELRVIGSGPTSGYEVVHPEMNLSLRIGSEVYNTPLFRDFSEQKYNDFTYKINSLRRKIIDEYKISEEEYDEFTTKFNTKLPTYLQDKWGIEIIKPTIIKKYSNNDLNESIIDDFIDFGKNELSLGDGFNVRLTDNNDELETLASYDMSNNEISVMSKNRAVPDIIRSIAHEMVHHKQNELGELRGNPEEGEDGSPWEDQANSKAGELVRIFGRKFPEIYDL